MLKHGGFLPFLSAFKQGSNLIRIPLLKLRGTQSRVNSTDLGCSNCTFQRKEGPLTGSWKIISSPWNILPAKSDFVYLATLGQEVVGLTSGGAGD